MKNKIFMILLILCIISISSVSAANVDDSITNEIDEIYEDISIDNMHEYVNDTNGNDNNVNNDGTFEELQNILYQVSDDDIITLDKNYSYSNGFKTGGMSIYNKLTIDGNGYTLDGKNTSRIFYISPNANKVTLKNINFINAYSEGAGGAILDDGSELIIDNCTFINNRIDGNVGGAIGINKANNNSITNCVFTGNKAQSSGGAVFITGDNSVLSDNIFIKNEVTLHLGGGACISGDNNIAKNNRFLENFAGRDGGGLDMEGANAGVRGIKNLVINNTFIGNVATFGAGLSFNTIDSRVEKNIFLNNKATGDLNEGFGGLGGAIRVMAEKNTTIINNTFINNTAFRQGGAIYIEDNYPVITKNIFKDNHAEIDAGGSINFKGTYATISDNIITLTTSPNAGGAIFCKGDYSKIMGNTITKAISKENGGALHVQGTSSIVSKNILTDNSAPILGGAIFFKGTKGTLENNIIKNNSARDGGAIYLESEGAKINGNKLTNNYASSRGGAIIARNDGITVNNNNMENNIVDGTGGALFLESNNGVVTNNNFTNNKVGEDQVGGAIRCYGDNVDINNNKFEKNTAKRGFALYGKGTGAKVSENTFVDAKKTDDTLRWDGTIEFINNIFTDDEYIMKTETKLTVKTVSYTILEKKQTLTAILTDSNNNPQINKQLTFKVDNKHYVGHTNNKGIATVTLNLKNVKNYPVTVIYDGDSTTEPAKFDSAKIIIHKDKTKAEMTKKTFKRSAKSKKVTFTLKNSKRNVLKNKKIIFKIKGKKYNVNTNKKGIATIKLKITKKGTYSLTATFAGDKTYSSVSKTVKIKII